MAVVAKLTIRVGSNATSSRIQVTTTGRYKSTEVNTVEVPQTTQPLFTTASPKDFWLAVVAAAQAEIMALP